MNATDYRIGNYLLDREGRLCKVEELSCKEGETEVSAPAIVGGMTSLPNKAIVLNEDWLLKFGFIKTGSDYRFRNWRFHVNKPANYDGFLLCDGYFVITDRIKYVYQLQNLYFDLTGEELQLKNERCTPSATT